jgi:hypothetical protein
MLVTVPALNPVFASAAVTLGRGAAAAVGDGLSFAAQLLQAVGGESPQRPADEKADRESAHSFLLRRIDELAQRIRRQLASAGFSLSKPVELAANESGGIAVAGLHPQQSSIEQILSGDVLLERDFDRLSADYAEFVGQHGAGDLPQVLTLVIPAAVN